MSMSFAMHCVIHRLNLPLFQLSPLYPVTRRRRPPRQQRHHCHRLAAQREATATLQERNAFQAFVGSFRQASPYIVEHAASLFVVVIPGEVTPSPFCTFSQLTSPYQQVIAQDTLFYALLADLQLLHCLLFRLRSQHPRCGFQASVFS